MRSRVQVTPVGGHDGEFGYVVRGVEDGLAARVAAESYLRSTLEYPDDAVGLVADTADRGHRLWRWNPCHPSSCYDGGGHVGHIGAADAPGHGVFRGVYLERPQ